MFSSGNTLRGWQPWAASSCTLIRQEEDISLEREHSSILHRLFLLLSSIEEGTYRCLRMVVQLSTLCTSPDMETVTKDLLTLWRQGSTVRREGDLLEVEKTGADASVPEAVAGLLG